MQGETSPHGRPRTSEEVEVFAYEEDKQDSNPISERVSVNDEKIGGSRSGSRSEDAGRYHRLRKGQSEDEEDAMETQDIVEPCLSTHNSVMFDLTPTSMRGLSSGVHINRLQRLRSNRDSMTDIGAYEEQAYDDEIMNAVIGIGDRI